MLYPLVQREKRWSLQRHGFSARHRLAHAVTSDADPASDLSLTSDRSGDARRGCPSSLRNLEGIVGGPLDDWADSACEVCSLIPRDRYGQWGAGYLHASLTPRVAVGR